MRDIIVSGAGVKEKGIKNRWSKRRSRVRGETDEKVNGQENKEAGLRAGHIHVDKEAGRKKTMVGTKE